MCRNIKTLANFAPPATNDEIRASALQFVRKLSGTSNPSKANEEAFDRAVNDVAAAAAGATALGLGTLVTVAASTAAADFTGIALASVVAAIGFFILPAKRKKAKEEMREKITDVRARLSEALRRQFTAEIQRSGDRIRESIAPYGRFIRAEGDKLKEIDRELTEISTAIGSLRARIERRAA